jgi:hypothetical protein
VVAWEVQLAGATLIGLSTLQLEFGFGVPQFQLAFHPILIALAASIALVIARLRLGRGGALLAVGAYLLVMVPLVVLVGPVFGRTFLHFPLYLAEAVLVELAALALRRDRPLAFGLVAGALVGTAGVAAEWAWSHAVMPLPWPASLLPHAAVLALVAGLAGGAIGSSIGRALAGLPQPPRRPALVPAAALAIVVAALALPLRTDPGTPVTASVTLDEASPAPAREVQATVRLDPPAAADGAKWFHAMAWQGGASRRVELREVAPGTYRTSAPIPVHGDWKANLRLHAEDAILALPVYLPADPAIPAPAVVAAGRFERPFVQDSEVLRREERGAATWLTGAAYGTLAAIGLAWLLAIGAAVTRFEHRRPAST